MTDRLDEIARETREILEEMAATVEVEGKEIGLIIAEGPIRSALSRVRREAIEEAAQKVCWACRVVSFFPHSEHYTSSGDTHYCKETGTAVPCLAAEIRALAREGEGPAEGGKEKT